MECINEIKFNDQGLVPAVAQDYKTGRVLMMAWMNAESISLTLEKKQAIYWSRSKNRLWVKGEVSGHVQRLHDLLLDCDGDTLLLMVEQLGAIACHTGRESCFYRKFDSIHEKWIIKDDIIKSPKQIYG